MSYINSLKSIFNANKFIGASYDEENLDAIFSFSNKDKGMDITVPLSDISDLIRLPNGQRSVMALPDRNHDMSGLRTLRGHIEIEKGCFVTVSEVLIVESKLASGAIKLKQPVPA